MISGSVAVEGGRALAPPFAVGEFLRPPPRAPPYRPAPEDAPSAAPSYPPVPGAYARFLPNFYGYGRSAYPPHGALPPPASLPLPPPPPPPPEPPARPAASAPRGKEGSMKHRLLSREQRAAPAARFSRGALIQLGSGQLRRVEDMRTEDFVLSADSSPELRRADSTVVRLRRRPAADTVTLTLSYNNNRTQVDMETPMEHPFFVYGQGWASCCPERTFQCYGLQVNSLQVGDVCVSLVPRAPPQLAATTVTTATATAMTARPSEAPQRYPENLSLREDSRKRRSSAPDICEENMQRPRTMLRHQ